MCNIISSATLLDIDSYRDDRFIKFHELNKLFEVFLNVEQVKCCINETMLFYSY
jgi:hypothetical protein